MREVPDRPRARMPWRGPFLEAMALCCCLVALSLSSARAETIEEKAQLCAGCHGDNGVPPEQAFPVPVIWGQNLGYLLFQLRDFKSGARKNEQMAAVVEGLEHNELIALAQYFSKKAWPKLQQSHPFTDVAAVVQRANASVVCAGCHQQGFVGEGMQPRLAGQDRKYLEKAMTDFQTGARGNNPGMSDLTRSVSTHDIAALAAWLGGM
jgi:cytochrome c553